MFSVRHRSTSTPLREKIVRRCMVVLGFGYCLFAVLHAHADWVAHSEQDGIRIWVRDADESRVQRVRAITSLNHTMPTVVAVLEDPALNPRWVPNSAGATLLDQPQPGASLVHFRLQGHWPVQPRDAVALFKKSRTEPGQVTITFTNAADQYPPMADHIRLEAYRGFWQLTETADGTHILYESLVDPGGNIPVWLVNRVAISSTRTALRNLRSLLDEITMESTP